MQRSWQLVRDFQVKTPRIETKIKSLSGGNIQKVIMARELARRPRVLVAAQPTRSVDIGATEYIHQRLLDQRAQGTATLLISEDLDEILALCDRIAVLYEGRHCRDHRAHPGHCGTAWLVDGRGGWVRQETRETGDQLSVADNFVNEALIGRLSRRDA